MEVQLDFKVKLVLFSYKIKAVLHSKLKALKQGKNITFIMIFAIIVKAVKEIYVIPDSRLLLFCNSRLLLL